MRFNYFDEFYKAVGEKLYIIFPNVDLIKSIYDFHLKKVNKIDNYNDCCILYENFNNIKYYLNSDFSNLLPFLIIKTIDTSLENKNAECIKFNFSRCYICYYEGDNLVVEYLYLSDGLNANAMVYNIDTINHLKQIGNINFENLIDKLFEYKIFPDFEINVSNAQDFSGNISTKLYRNGLLFDEYDDERKIEDKSMAIYAKFRNLLDGFDNRIDITKILKK